MWSICKKEFRQFFSNLTGLVAILLFLLLNGLMLFVLPDTSIFDFGYANMDKFFSLSPWILLLLIPSITMRSFSEEFKAGTYEILQTSPLSHWQIVNGKFFGCFLVVVIALIPTILYVLSVKSLSVSGEIDTGAIIGSYIGLLFLAAVFTAIGIFCSSFTNNAVMAFIICAAACVLLYSGFEAISKIPGFTAGPDYRSVSRGVIDSRDVIYFLSSISLFLFFTHRNLVRR
jgi:ABC-2 type transport system permease protein